MPTPSPPPQDGSSGAKMILRVSQRRLGETKQLEGIEVIWFLHSGPGRDERLLASVRFRRLQIDAPYLGLVVVVGGGGA